MPTTPKRYQPGRATGGDGRPDRRKVARGPAEWLDLMRAVGVRREPRELVGRYYRELAMPHVLPFPVQVGHHGVELDRAPIAEHRRHPRQAIGQAFDARRRGHGFPKVRRAKARAKATSSGSLATRYGVKPAARSVARCGS